MQPARNAVVSPRAPLARPLPNAPRVSALASAMLGLSLLAACGGGKAPAGLTYANSNAVFTLGTAVSDAPTITGTVVSWDIAPALPGGLNLDAGTGVISGTPTALSAQTVYTVTATNKDGKTTGTVTITVNDAAPAGLAYDSPAVFTKGTPKTLAPKSTGGAVVSYAVAPALPAGLALDAKTGVISGNATLPTAQKNYVVTATNITGSTTATVSIVVNDAAPASLAYPGTPFLFTKGTAIGPIAPATTGGVVTSYTVNPALPAGIIIDGTTGVLSGTPTGVSPDGTYTVTATNVSGLITTTISFSVRDAAPAGLTYAGSPAFYTILVGAAPLTPSSTGGNILAYAISPELPPGLSFNTATGVIFGTPTALSPQISYTVTATNNTGASTGTVLIAVNDLAPGSLSYPASSLVLTRGVAASTLSPTVSGGGAVTGFTVTPALPAGLSLDAATGVFSGTPTVVSAQASYLFSANNSGGSATAAIVITVKDTAPAGLFYPNGENSYVFVKGQASTTGLPTSTGGAIVSYTVSPALPPGLSINAATGEISGTPTAVVAGASYTVTGLNTGGSTTVGVSITVRDVAPSALVYPNSALTFTVNQAIAPQTPSNAGGAVVSYSVSPALPAGLVLDSGTGVLSGRPTAITASAAYTVTAVNTGGSTTATLTIAVNDAAPTALTYATSPLVTTVGVLITPDAPSSAGGAVISYSVAPALPAGLALDAGTGIISGTPTAIADKADYVVTATNSGGNATVTLSITVNAPAPTNLTYSQNPATYSLNTAITPNTPSSAGGAVVSYAVAPALPAGLALDTTTGIISGTPTATAATADYVVTATNSGGSTTATLSITVNIAAPSNLTYSQNPAGYAINVAITPNTPTSTGGAVASYAVAPALPAGLALDTTTGIISGTPTTSTAQATYVVTATNVTGSTTANLVLAVGAPPTFSVQPANTTAQVGGTATFTATADAAEGNGPVTYQWLENGAVITGATSASYTTPATVAADDGSLFSVTATDAIGLSVTSQTATLTVLIGAIAPGPAMDVARAGHVAVTLKDGRTLFAGDAVAGTQASLFDPATRRFTALTAHPKVDRVHASATLLGNGKVLIVGGLDPNGVTPLGLTAEIFDPATSTFTATASPAVPRALCGLVTLANGNALAVGNDSNDNTAEIYDQTAGTWSPAGTLVVGQVLPSLIALANNTVLVIGGGTSDVELFDPTANSGAGGFTTLTPLSQERAQPVTAVLQDGRVLVAGGDIAGAPTASAEVYDPAGTTTVGAGSVPGLDVAVGNMTAARAQFITATTLGSGKVLLAGGVDASNLPVGGLEIFDPTSLAFTTPGPLATPRASQSATLLPNGKVLLAGGVDSTGTALMSTELFQ
jgi:hypothetical protein